MRLLPFCLQVLKIFHMRLHHWFLRPVAKTKRFLGSILSFRPRFSNENLLDLEDL